MILFSGKPYTSVLAIDTITLPEQSCTPLHNDTDIDISSATISCDYNKGSCGHIMSSTSTSLKFFTAPKEGLEVLVEPKAQGTGNRF